MADCKTCYTQWDRSLITTWGGRQIRRMDTSNYLVPPTQIARKIAFPPMRIREKFGFPPQQVTQNRHLPVFIQLYFKEMKTLCQNQDYQWSKKISPPINLAK